MIRILVEWAEGPAPLGGVADLRAHQLETVEHGARQRLQLCAVVWHRISDEQLLALGARRPTAAPRSASARLISARITLAPGMLPGWGPQAAPSAPEVFWQEDIMAPRIPRVAGLLRRMVAGWSPRHGGAPGRAQAAWSQAQS